VLYGGNKVMNSAGVIASYDGQKGVALWRDPSHSPSVLEPGGFVAGINDLDRIAGTHGQAFLWRPDRPQANTGTTYDLGTLPGDQRSEATGINSRGQIVGISRRFWGEGAMVRERAFRWKPAVANGTSGTMKDLGVPAGGVHSRALAINETGIVVGSYTTAAGALRAFRYMSAMNDLNFHILGASGWELQEALDINSSGQILCSGTHLGWLATCLLTPTAWRLSDVDFLRAVTLILGGVRDDSGGWVIPPGRGPVPVPPWVAQFWQRASASKRRSLQKLAVRAPEELIDDEESRRLLHRLVPQLASLRARIGE
jgi:probable HAF family extracellular repeat protein